MSEQSDKLYKEVKKIQTITLIAIIVAGIICFGLINLDWLLGLYLVFGVIVIMWKRKALNKVIQPYTNILMNQCDPVYLLELSQTISNEFSGKKGMSARIIRESMEQLYLSSLNALERYEDILKFVNEGNRLHKKFCRLYLYTIKCNMASIAEDKDAYEKACEKLSKAIKKKPQWKIQKLSVMGEYEEALKILNTVKPKCLYEQVVFASAHVRCYMALGRQNEAQKHIRFVIENGNTLALKERIIKKYA